MQVMSLKLFDQITEITMTAAIEPDASLPISF